MIVQPASHVDSVISLDKSSIVRSTSESCLTVATDESVSSVESEDMAAPPASEGYVKAPLKRRRSSIRPFNVEEIPINNRGWKNLPKVTNTALPRSCLVDQQEQHTVHKSQHVAFCNVEFRCFEQCAGDNPSVSIGTPISLDWEFEDMEALNVDAYEESRGVRRTPRQLMMNYFQRRTLLSYRYGLSEEEIDAAEKAANRLRNQRALTRTLLPASILEDLVTSAARKTKRALSKNDTAPVFQSEEATVLSPQPKVLPSEPAPSLVIAPPEPEVFETAEIMI